MHTPTIIDSHVLLGCENHLTLDVDTLLHRMDEHEVAIAIARPMGAGLVVRNREGNDLVLSSSERIRGLVSANPWWGQDAVDELKRCREQGAVGLFLDPARQGYFPTDPLVIPLLTLAGEFGWPVMFQTGTYIFSDLLAVAEVARDYPKTPFIVGYGGFADMWFELPGVFGAVPNLYLDTSMIWGGAIREIVDRFGSSRLLFGSAEPRSRYAAAISTIRRLDLPQDVFDAIMFTNAKRLFGLL